MANDTLEPRGHVEGRSLREEDLARADLEGCTFTDCVIEDAQLNECVLRDATFTRCQILRSRFAHTDLRDARFDDCTFVAKDTHEGVAFSFCDMGQITFQKCELSFALFERSDLFGITATECRLRGARFVKADFSRAFGRKVIRSSATFTGCSLELADLSQAAFAACTLTDCDLREANFFRADLTDADLSGSNLCQTAFEGAKLAGADVRGAETSGLDLMTLANFTGLKITLEQQSHLLAALGVDVRPR